MQDRPTAQELVETVARFLSDELAPVQTDPRLRFRVLIAANVLSIVGRELAAGDPPLLAEWQGLAALLGQDFNAVPPRSAELQAAITAANKELCARIRAGAMDSEPLATSLNDHLLTTAISRLQIANPRYLQRLRG